ncbi:MAG: hypothetical protein ACOH2F_00915 [Cellulomonas sp.]
MARPTAVIAWATAAALAGSIVWWAVAAIGSEGGAPTVFSQAQVARLASEPRAPAATPTSSSTPAPVVSPSETPTPLPEPTPTKPAPTASGSPRSTPVPVRPSTAPPVAAPKPEVPAPVAVARTWNVSGGQVSVECRGAQIVLLSATPQSGWSVDVQHGGPDEIEVKFRQREADTSVHAVCVGGVPEMTGDNARDD